MGLPLGQHGGVPAGPVAFGEGAQGALRRRSRGDPERRPVVGRKNYYGSGAIWNGKLTAILFTLFQTLLLWKLNPRHWLVAYFEACARAGGEVPPNLEQWLPWNLEEERRQDLSRPAPSWEDTS